MVYEITCTKCGTPSVSLLNPVCPLCGNLLEIRLEPDFEKSSLLKDTHSIWRYAHSFPYVKKTDIVTLGEGWTPLLHFSGNLYLKLDNLNPTGSFKDRGSATLVSAVRKPVKASKGYVSEDSSGNAGASIAAYAARAGMKARIYVPETVAGVKYSQILSYGAEVIKISGSRTHVTEEAEKVEENKFYIGHVVHPLFRDGIRSMSYEIAEQFGWDPPERIYMPVSAGTLLLGVLSGFRHLRESGIIDRIPKVIACQTEQVSPVYHKFKGTSYNPPDKVTSVADALVSVNPPLLGLMVGELRDAKGDAEIVNESEILGSYAELARQGLLVEPSSAVAFAAYSKQLKNGKISNGESTVILLTGNGLKSSLKL